MNSRQIFAGLFGLGFSAAVAAAGPVYYVSNIGDDANNGRSPEQAWRTINKVNSSVNATGADVYLRAGDVWDDRVLTVDWSGTAEDPAIVGAYHFDGGQLRHDAGELRKPEINGTLESACRRAKNCAMQSSRAVPTSTYRGLIHLAARHVTIQNLRLRDSAGQMISFDTNNLPRHIVIEGNDMTTPLTDANVFPSMVVSMIGVGEATGAMDTMLNKIADFYEEEVDVAIDGLTSMIEPIMMIFVGGIVGTMMVAMYLPIFSMGKAVG